MVAHVSVVGNGDSDSALNVGDASGTTNAGDVNASGEFKKNGVPIGTAVGDAGIVQMSDGAGAFVESAYEDDQTTSRLTLVKIKDVVGKIYNSPGLEVSGDGSTAAGLAVSPPAGGEAVLEADGFAGQGHLILSAARNTRNDPQALQNGDPLGEAIVYGYNGASYVLGGALKFTATADFSGTPKTRVDLVNLDGLGLHIAGADGAFSVDVLAPGFGVVFPRTVAGTTDTLLASDNGKGILYTSDSPVAITVPVDLGAFQCFAIQGGAGTLTFTPTGGAVLRNRQSHNSTGGQWAVVSLTSSTADNFDLAGDTGGSGGGAAGPVGTVQMSDGAGGFVVSDFFDTLGTPGSATAGLTDTGFIISNSFQIEGNLGVVPKTGSAASRVYFSGFGVPPSINIFEAEGTREAPTATLTGVDMGSWFWQGYDGSDLVPAARIKVTAQSDFNVTPTSKIDITNASNLGAHIAATGGMSLDTGLVNPGGNAVANMVDSAGELVLSAGLRISSPDGTVGPFLGLQPVFPGSAAASVIEIDGTGLNPQIIFARADGVVGTPTTLLNNGIIGNVSWYGYDGATYAFAGQIKVTAASDFSGTPTSSIDITNASNLGAHIAADGTLTVDHGVVAGTGTTTAAAGAATLDKVSGIVTSEALVAAVTYTLTLTNSFVSASSVVMVVPIASTGIAVPITSITEGSGSVVIVVTSAALTGTIKFRFQVNN